LELISCDMAESIATAIIDRCPNAIRCVDPFHVIKVRHEALPVRAGCKTLPPGCRGSPVKLRTV
ncbi:MAG: transposase, partial [Solirubrobacteraceae bacterium]